MPDAEQSRNNVNIVSAEVYFKLNFVKYDYISLKMFINVAKDCPNSTHAIHTCKSLSFFLGSGDF